MSELSENKNFLKYLRNYKAFRRKLLSESQVVSQAEEVPALLSLDQQEFIPASSSELSPVPNVEQLLSVSFSSEIPDVLDKEQIFPKPSSEFETPLRHKRCQVPSQDPKVVQVSARASESLIIDTPAQSLSYLQASRSGSKLKDKCCSKKVCFTFFESKKCRFGSKCLHSHDPNDIATYEKQLVLSLERHRHAFGKSVGNV
jgi:hypothetical protein